MAQIFELDAHPLSEDWLKTIGDGRYQRQDLAAHDAALAAYRLQVARRLKHLPGQHDQASHGRRGAGLEAHENIDLRRFHKMTRTDSKISPEYAKQMRAEFNAFSTDTEKVAYAREMLKRVGYATAEPLPEHVQKAVEAADRKLLQLTDHEESYAFDVETGDQLLYKVGEAGRVSFDRGSIWFIQGQVLTHNHPGGGPFSDADVRFAQKMRLREMRAIGSDGTRHVLRLGEFSLSMSWDGFAEGVQIAQARAENEWVMLGIREPGLSPQQRNLRGSQLFMQELQKMLPTMLYYTEPVS